MLGLRVGIASRASCGGIGLACPAVPKVEQPPVMRRAMSSQSHKTKKQMMEPDIPTQRDRPMPRYAVLGPMGPMIGEFVSPLDMNGIDRWWEANKDPSQWWNREHPPKAERDWSLPVRKWTEAEIKFMLREIDIYDDTYLDEKYYGQNITASGDRYMHKFYLNDLYGIDLREEYLGRDFRKPTYAFQEHSQTPLMGKLTKVLQKMATKHLAKINEEGDGEVTGADHARYVVPGVAADVANTKQWEWEPMKMRLARTSHMPDPDSEDSDLIWLEKNHHTQHDPPHWEYLEHNQEMENKQKMGLRQIREETGYHTIYDDATAFIPQILDRDARMAAMHEKFALTEPVELKEWQNHIRKHLEDAMLEHEKQEKRRQVQEVGGSLAEHERMVNKAGYDELGDETGGMDPTIIPAKVKLELVARTVSRAQAQKEEQGYADHHPDDFSPFHFDYAFIPKPRRPVDHYNALEYYAFQRFNEQFHYLVTVGIDSEAAVPVLDSIRKGMHYLDIKDYADEHGGQPNFFSPETEVREYNRAVRIARDPYGQGFEAADDQSAREFYGIVPLPDPRYPESDDYDIPDPRNVYFGRSIDAAMNARPREKDGWMVPTFWGNKYSWENSRKDTKLAMNGPDVSQMKSVNKDTQYTIGDHLPLIKRTEFNEDELLGEYFAQPVDMIVIPPPVEEAIHRLYEYDPEHWNHRKLAEEFAMSLPRVRAILRLKIMEKALVPIGLSPDREYWPRLDAGVTDLEELMEESCKELEEHARYAAITGEEELRPDEELIPAERMEERWKKWEQEHMYLSKKVREDLKKKYLRLSEVDFTRREYMHRVEFLEDMEQMTGLKPYWEPTYSRREIRDHAVAGGVHRASLLADFEMNKVREDEARYWEKQRKYKVRPRDPNRPPSDRARIHTDQPLGRPLRHRLVVSDTASHFHAEDLIVKVREHDGSMRNPDVHELIRAIQKERPHWTQRMFDAEKVQYTLGQGRKAVVAGDEIHQRVEDSRKRFVYLQRQKQKALAEQQQQQQQQQ